VVDVIRDPLPKKKLHQANSHSENGRVHNEKFFKQPRHLDFEGMERHK
jgi:hypothetical protein